MTSIGTMETQAKRVYLDHALKRMMIDDVQWRFTMLTFYNLWAKIS